MNQKIEVTNTSELYLKFLSDIQTVACRFESRITIQKGEVTVNAKNFEEILKLIGTKGTKLEITVEGKDAKKALAAICRLAEQNYLRLNHELLFQNNN